MLPPLLALALALAAAPDLRTTAEASGYARTGRLAEVERLCRDFPRAFPGRARCLTFGATPEGRPLLALVASGRGRLTPRAARPGPVVLLQASIHAGEMDGKDAGFEALRALLEEARAGRGPLLAATALFVPVLNADGHERFGPGQRPNQAGPEETGWRVNARNLNLNRDWTKAEAPETQAMLRLLAAWDPDACADLHVTDGARFRHEVAVMVAPTKGGAEALRGEGIRLRDALLERLAAAGHAPLAFYPEFEAHDDPASGIADGMSWPRLSHGYWAEEGRLGLLVETHSWIPYRARVAATRITVDELLRQAAARGPAWRAARRAAERAARALGGTAVPLTWRPTGAASTVELRGYAYTREPSPVSGAPVVAYDAGRPEAWRVPFRGDLEPDVVVRAPRAGYLVPPAHAGWVAEKLRLHQVAFRVLRAAVPGAAVERHRAGSHAYLPPAEGRTPLAVKGAWEAGRADLLPGSLFVPVDQPRARLLLHLLEPDGPDALLSWGFFSAHYEKKEYLEDYVVEPFARELLARDAGVRAAFEARLADPAFAGDPQARLDFFRVRHPSWDDRYRLYPVLRLDVPPPM